MRTLFTVSISLFFFALSMLGFLIGDPHGGSRILPNSLMSIRYFLEQKHLLDASFLLGPIFMLIAGFSMFWTVGWGIKLFSPKCSECGRRTHYVGSKMDSLDFDTIFYRCKCGNRMTSSSMDF